MSRPAPLAAVAQYYDAKVQRFGPTPLGADWLSMGAVRTRIHQLLHGVALDIPLTLNDLGCGWGATLDVLDEVWSEGIDYVGIDVAPAMIEAARSRWAGRGGVRFAVGSTCTRQARYTVASGIFNVKLGTTRASWERHIQRTLRDMHANSIDGFAVNFLLPSTRTRSVPELYTTTPEPWVAFCTQSLGRRVSVISDYGLAEITLLAR